MNVSGTASVSVPVSARPSVTVTTLLPPFSAISPDGAESATVVLSSSVMVMLWLFWAPSLASDGFDSSTVKPSVGSSSVSSVTVTVKALLVSATLNSRLVLAIAVKSLPPVAVPSLVA